MKSTSPADHPHFNREDWQQWLKELKSFLHPTPVSAIQDKADDLRPYLTLEIYGRSYRGLLDSGSEISIIGGDNYFKHFKTLASLYPSHNLSHIVTANGSSSSVSGYVLLPVTVGGTTHIVKFFVITCVTTPLLLGLDFWKAFDIAPDVLSLLNVTRHSQPPGCIDLAEIRCLRAYDHLTSAQRRQATDIIRKFDSISSAKRGLGRTHLVTHRIDTGSAMPIKQRYYMMSPSRLTELNKQLDEMLRDDVVEPSCSPWNNPVTMALKSDGGLRFCLDSRKLNQLSKHDAYPLPYITHILDQLREARYLSSIDLKSAFWQVPLEESSKEKTAFTVPGRGLFHFKVMCFGLTSAPATQQRLMDLLFGPEFSGKIFIYLDDIIIVSSSFHEHLHLLDVVADKLSSANLSINFEKCCFFRKQLKYLGYVVDEQGLRTDPEKVKAIIDFPIPLCKKDVKRFLGTASYYRRFIKNFSTIAAPLNALTSTKKKAPPFEWSPAAERAFNSLKEALTSAPVLACPDFSQPFAVHCDASNYGIGGTLTQTLEGIEHPVAYFSRSLSPPERNYSATEREALAVVLVVEHFRPYLEGAAVPFRIITDHSSLKWFLNLKNPSGRLERWGCRLSPYNFVVEHRRGSENVVPDALSRSVPVSSVGVQSPDEWYKNIFDRCKSNPSSCPNFQIIDDRLFRYSRTNNSLISNFEWKEVVPSEKVVSVLTENHSSPTAAHLGVYKTYNRIKLRYFWPKMYRDTVKFVLNCGVCKAYKVPNQSTPGFMGSPKVCTRPFQCISIDLVGPLPLSRLQNAHLLVVVCCFSKYCLLFPLRRATGRVVAQRLEDHVFLMHGIPQTVIADNGSQFVGAEIKSLFDRYKIPQVHYGPVYCPQVNTVERYNRTVITAISTLVGNDHRLWDVNLPKIQFAINTSVNESTGFSPFLLVHGREAVPSGSLYPGHQTLTEIEFADRQKFVDSLGPLKAIFTQVRDELRKAHEKNAKYYNKRRRDITYRVGDYVWKRSYRNSDGKKYFAAKLAPKYERCRIVGKLSPLVYELQDESGKSVGKWHIKDFKSD